MIKQLMVFLLAGMSSVAGFALPAAFNASYSVSKSGLTLGEMRVSLSYTNNHYAYHKSTRATGLAAWLSGDKMIENADGKVHGNSIFPESYLFHHTSKRKDRKDQLQFVNPRLAKGSYKGRAYSIQVPGGTLDRAALELALARDLAAQKKSLTYSIVERGKLKTYHLTRQGVEKINIGGKNYHAEKIMVARKGAARKTILWLAKELDYMPVKINHIEKGDAIVSNLKWFKFTGK